MPIEPILNHIKTYAIDTGEREEQSQQNWRLFHVNLFGKNTIEEGIMNMKFMNLPITRDHNGED